MMSRQPPSLRDLLLAVVGIEECAAKLGRRRDYMVIFARQSRRRDVQIAIGIDCESAMKRGAQAYGLCLNIGLAFGRPRDEAAGSIGVAEGMVRAFPIQMIVAGAKMGDPQGGGESDCASQIGGCVAWQGRGVILGTPAERREAFQGTRRSVQAARAPLDGECC